ncbi:MAG: hypothetical protein ABL949_04895 [Fimbriimonadaceae bacterium]
MRRTFGIIAALVLAQITFGQTVEKKRMDVINDIIYNRMVDQSDAWWEDGDYPRIINMMWLLFIANPNDYEAATNLGWMLANIERYDDELAVYVKYRVSNPNNAEASFPEANFYFQKKAYAKVPPLLEASIKKSPHANSYRILAHSYDKLGLLQDAKRVWQAYLTKNPNDETAKNNLKKIEAKIKDSR